MKKYFITFKRMLKKNRFQFACFTLIIFISSLFLNLGLTIVLNFNNNIQKKLEDAKMPDVHFLVNDQIYTSSVENDLENIKSVKSSEVRDCFVLPGSLYAGDGSDVMMPLVVLNRDDNHEYNKISLESVGTDGQGCAYVSYWLKSYYNCKLGDTIKYKCGNDEYSFKIAGFVEDAQFGNNNCGYLGVHLSKAQYDEFAKQDSVKNYASKNINLITDNHSDSEKAYHDGYKILSSLPVSAPVAGDSFTQIFGFRTTLVDILAYMVVLFALAITLVSLFVCGFRIRNGIDEDMQSIGTMKALGFSSRQIRASISLPYIIICMLSCFIGIGCSFMLIPVFTNLTETITGLLYRQIVDPVSVLLSFGILTLTVVITILLSTKRIRRISPVVALESGIEHHNFKRNFCPIKNSHLPVDVTLGMKNFFSMLKQNISLFVILSLLTFLVLFGVSGFYNLNVHPINFINTISEELCSIDAITKDDASVLAAKLDNEKGIRKTVKYQTQSIEFDGLTADAFICEDYSRLDNNTFYSGRKPAHDNEAALGSSYDKKYKVGDTVTVTCGKVSYNYLVVGFFQTPDDFGRSIAFNIEGFKNLDKNYVPQRLFIYLNDGFTSDECVTMLKNNYNYLIKETYNNDALMRSSMGPYLSMTAILAGTILAVVILITALILFIVFSTFIIQRRTDFGILKSVGYTSRRIMLQSVLGLLPSLVAGIAGGGILGYFFMNNFWLLALSSMQLRKCFLAIPAGVISAVCFFLLAVSILISIMLLSKGTRKISPTRLIQD